ncbi:MAG: hypothetical protein PHV74_02400 [Dehalococcoidia bacterium]|nr:hypothetical protein [Dehalococcoidia bacterium]
MQKLSEKKHVNIVRLYLLGLPYDEIAKRAGVAKGSVAGVVSALKAGQIPGVHEPSEQIEQLRELASNLQRSKISPVQAVVGITVLSHLQELGIEPGDIDHWAAVCRQLTPDETSTQAFVKAALYLDELRGRTGLTAEALAEKVRSLEKEVERLQTLAQELDGCQRQLNDLERRRQSLVKEVSGLEKCRDPLRKEVIRKEKREAELSGRTTDLEQKAQAADERLGVARKEIKLLAGLGLSVDDLSGWVQRLAAVSHRHGITPGALRDRLLHELENLDAGLGLESLVKARRHRLDEIARDVARAQIERTALQSALQELRKQQASLHATMADEREHLQQEMLRFNRIAADAAAGLKKDLGKGVGEALLEIRRLRDESLELGKEMGKLDAAVEANRWVRTLISLVKEGGHIVASDARVLLTMVLRGFSNWVAQNQGVVSMPYGLKAQVTGALREVEQWKI